MTNQQPRLGLPAGAIVALGLLAAPRAVLHDLDLIEEGSVVNAVLVVAPLLVWIGVAVLRATALFPALLAAGGVYGVCLAVVHNVLWSRARDGEPPRLGGNLSGRLPAPAEELLLRGAMTVGSVFTGLAVGTICGVVAWAVVRLTRRGATES